MGSFQTLSQRGRLDGWNLSGRLRGLGALPRRHWEMVTQSVGRRQRGDLPGPARI